MIHKSDRWLAVLLCVVTVLNMGLLISAWFTLLCFIATHGCYDLGGLLAKVLFWLEYVE